MEWQEKAGELEEQIARGVVPRFAVALCGDPGGPRHLDRVLSKALPRCALVSGGTEIMNWPAVGSRVILRYGQPVVAIQQIRRRGLLYPRIRRRAGGGAEA
jgi:hypothetical protein